MTVPRTNAGHDQNFVPTLIGVSTSDGLTPVPIEVDPTTGAMLAASPAGLFTRAYDRMVVTYTDSTKATISTIVTKLSGVTQETITNTSSTTVDDLQRS